MTIKSFVRALTMSAPMLLATHATAASPEENRQLIADYYAAYGSGDMSRVTSFFADDIEWHIPGHHPLAGTKRGKEEVAAFFQQLGRAKFRAELIALMADENWVIDLHRGWSNRADGGNVDTLWVLAFRIENGKIREARNFSYDQAAADIFFWQAYPLKPLQDRLLD
ncbi:nuclear transport factor 2 family protein [Sinorhizobium numidicum]|uniref:Nuclear transport factor 2 family protein n=1 Tax=Sinorhizobium numidicum TaxID=680248 RepID=A0ABY8CMM4_9HYPH|nr:nuclear transport factor 2 family protein [Sinorhizobium numidicum]WEX73920.1 nuclear transport factor 2 family protein [Sinorhizobium numidicum]WEX79905.1 nuclear transport factor 2 family protein [Sinorhizobium numidicum]